MVFFKRCKLKCNCGHICRYLKATEPSLHISWIKSKNSRKPLYLPLDYRNAYHFLSTNYFRSINNIKTIKFTTVNLPFKKVHPNKIATVKNQKPWRHRFTFTNMIGLYLVQVGEGLLRKIGENRIFQLQSHMLVKECHKYVCRKQFGDNF